MPAIPAIVMAAKVATAAKTAYDVGKSISDAKKAKKNAAQAAADAASGTGMGTTNIEDLDARMRTLAQKNAADSASLLDKYNPGVSELRAGSMNALNAGLNPDNPTQKALIDRIAAQAGQPLSGVNMPTEQQFDSALTRQVADKAAADLALGGKLPQDVRNLIARRGLATAGAVTGNLGLGRDLVARDLGRTSLDIEQQRINNASDAARMDAAMAQANAALRQQNQGLGLQAQGMNMQAEQFGRGNLFDSANFLNNLQSGNFARALQAAQLSQNIANPVSGLDPGSMANIAIGNTNVAAERADRAAAIAQQAKNASDESKNKLIGAGLGFVQNWLGNKATPKLGTTTVPNSIQPIYQKPYNPGFVIPTAITSSYFK